MLAVISRRGSRVGQQFICSSCLCNVAAQTLPLATVSPHERVIYPNAPAFSRSFSTSLVRHKDSSDVSPSQTADGVSADPPQLTEKQEKKKERARFRTRAQRKEARQAAEAANIDRWKGSREKSEDIITSPVAPGTAPAKKPKETVKVASKKDAKKPVKSSETITSNSSRQIREIPHRSDLRRGTHQVILDKPSLPVEAGEDGNQFIASISADSENQLLAKKAPKEGAAVLKLKAPKKAAKSIAPPKPMKPAKKGINTKSTAPLKPKRIPTRAGGSLRVGGPLIRKITQGQTLTRRLHLSKDPYTDPGAFLADLNKFTAELDGADPEATTLPDNARGTLVELIQSGKLKGDQRLEAIKLLRRLLLVQPAAAKTLPSATDEPIGNEQSLKAAMLQGTLSRPILRSSNFPKGSSSKKDKSKPRPGPIPIPQHTKEYEIKTIDSSELKLVPLESDGVEVPKLAYGLDRVLFNPGVYQLQDPRSKVYNFDPYLQQIMPTTEFDFNALAPYITSSRDEVLLGKARQNNKKYTGSTSSMTSALAHFHFLLSQWRPITTGNLSKQFPVEYETFTALQRSPNAIFLRNRDGVYAIDADKQYDSANVLMMLGKSMEKLLTLPTDEFEKYRRGNSHQISEETRNAPESFHYTTIGDFLLRSQLDAYDPRLPGTGMFDLKTRAVIAVRMDAKAFEEGRGYQIRKRIGEWESYEREYFDMIRAAFLKYSLQVRMGRMDGIFVAFHNTTKIFGFQYISLPEMDLALHGTDDTAIGDNEFKLSLELLNRVLDRATAKFPGESLRLHFEARDAVTPFMYIFAEPVSEERINQIQSTNKAAIEEFERKICGIAGKDLTDEDRKAAWDNIRADVADSMRIDEQTPDESEEVDDPRGFTSSALAAEELDNSEEVIDEDAEVEEELSEEEIEKIAADTPEGIEEQAEGATSEVEEEEQDEETTTEIGTEGKELVDSAASGEAEDVEATSDGATEDALEEDEGEESTATKDAEDDIIDVDAETEDMEPLFSETTEGTRTDILGMTLTIRNKLDNEYIERPERLRKGEKWAVEYALEEMLPQQTTKQYIACTMRRKRTHTKSVDLANTASWNDLFLDTIKRLSSEGRLWREKEDLKESKLPFKTLYPVDGKYFHERPDSKESKRGGLDTISEELEEESVPSVQSEKRMTFSEGAHMASSVQSKERTTFSAGADSALDSLRRDLGGK